MSNANVVSRARKVAAKAAAAEFADDAADLEPGKKKLDGKVGGTLFDWQSNLYLDSDAESLWDGGDRFARDMREALRSDWKLRQLAEILTAGVKGATWSLKPGKGDTGEAEDTEEKLRRPHESGGMRTPIFTVIGQASSAVIYQRAYFAKGFMLDPVKADGSILYSDLAMRPASTCRLRRDPESGHLDGFEQDVVYYSQAAGKGWDGKPVRFKNDRALVFINGVDRDPVSGVSDLEVAIWCWRTKQKLLLLWWTFLEAQALPRTLVKHTGDADRAKAAATMIASLKSSGVGYFDGAAMQVDTLDTSGKGGGPFYEAIKYMDSCASGSVLAGFTDLTGAAASGRGSFALSSDARDGFGETREHAMREMEGTLTGHAVAPLVRINFGAQGKVPSFAFDPLAGVDEQPLFALLQALATAQTTTLPAEFVSQLALEAARLLHLDVEKVEKAIASHAHDAEQAAQAAGANAVGQQAAALSGAVTGTVATARDVVKRSAKQDRQAAKRTLQRAGRAGAVL